MVAYREYFDDTKKDGAVRGFLHPAEATSDDCLVLTHGAGSNCNAPLLVALAEQFCQSGCNVLRCDLPFRQSRPHGSPIRGSAELDQRGLRAAVESMRQLFSGEIFLGGHSYGGRQATMLAASEPGLVPALLLLSYPLHPPKQMDKMRTSHFPQLQTRSIFVHGTRDGFGSLEEMTAALELIPAPTQLMPVKSAGHELLTKANRATLPGSVEEAFRLFTKSDESERGV